MTAFDLAGGALELVGRQDNNDVLLAAPYVPVSAGSISSPSPQLDIALPVGPRLFELTLIGLHADMSDLLTARFSSDGGNTFADGSSDYNTRVSNLQSSTAIQNDNGPSDQGFIGTISSEAIKPSFFKLYIDPGANHRYPTIFSMGQVGGGASPICLGGVTLGVQERQNMIRISGFIGDGVTLNGGSYTLFGWR